MKSADCRRHIKQQGKSHAAQIHFPYDSETFMDINISATACSPPLSHNPQISLVIVGFFFLSLTTVAKFFSFFFLLLFLLPLLFIWCVCVCVVCVCVCMCTHKGVDVDVFVSECMNMDVFTSACRYTHRGCLVVCSITLYLIPLTEFLSDHAAKPKVSKPHPQSPIPSSTLTI